jgi:8-oxo-dGTP pyrophosphatase MutT (NUDIX family)
MLPVSVGVLEILVTGVTASIWFGLLVAVLAGWTEPPNSLGDSPVQFLVYVSLAYGLGVIVDGVADSLFTAMLPRGDKSNWVAQVAARSLAPKDGRQPLSGPTFERLRRSALMRDDGLAKFMEYQRSRQRIARAMSLNMLLLLFVGIWFLIAVVDVGSGIVLGFAVVVLTAMVLSGRVAERLRVAYEGHLAQMPALATDTLPTWTRAACVCVRTTSSGTRVLVVRTKESASIERWTFPKGHVEKGESLLESAMREAEEEAGARGVVDPVPLPPYLFPGGGSGESLVVIPYLMTATEVSDPTEPGRATRWCSPEEAKSLLQSNREAQFATEHDRVIDAAIQRLH